MDVRRGVRVGLAALVVGWSLTGGAGVGFADTGSASAATSPGSSRDSAGASASRAAAAGAPGSHRARPVAARATDKTAAGAPGTAAARAAAGVGTPTVATAIAAGRADGPPRRQGRVTGDTPRAATLAHRARAAVAIPGLPAPEPTPAVGAVAAAQAQPAVEGSPAATAAATATAQRATTPTREISPSSVLTTAAARITAAIDKVLNRLSTLPASRINEFLSGALLLVRRALQPTGSLPGAPFRNGATQLTVRNKTDVSFEIWAYADGDTDNELLYVTTLAPGAEWTNTAQNYWHRDHDLVLGVTGPNGQLSKRMEFVAQSFSDSDYMDLEWVRLIEGREQTVGDSPEGRIAEGQSFLFGSSHNDVVAWGYRGYNIESSDWWDAPTVVFEVEIWRMPEFELNVDDET
ncbi:MAG: hypothetical protein KDB71_16210 [Mycobacterium sp.]|nr:hypothetical protein [Mycobacterium sp.]